MPVKSTQVSVLTTAPGTQLCPAATYLNNVGTTSDPIPVTIENQDATNPVYLGPTGVTSSTGQKLSAGSSLAFQFVGSDMTTLFAIATGGTVTVSVLAGRQ